MDDTKQVLWSELGTLGKLGECLGLEGEQWEQPKAPKGLGA